MFCISVVKSIVSALISVVLSLFTFRRQRIRELIVCSSIGFFVLGCSHHHYVDFTHSEDVRSLEQKAEKHSFTVSLRSGTQYTAKNLLMDSDSTSWVWARTGVRMRVSTADIEEIRFVRRGKGAAEGAGFGFLIGALAGGLLIGLAAASDAGASGSGELVLSDRDVTLIVAGFVGAVGVFGAIVGATAGAIVGNKEVYHPVSGDLLRIRKRSRSRQKPDGSIVPSP